MKKSFKVLTMLVLASALLLAACGGADNAGDLPGGGGDLPDGGEGTDGTMDQGGDAGMDEGAGDDAGADDGAGVSP